MSPELVVALATLITSITAAFIAVFNTMKIQETHLAVNSKMTELLTVSKAMAKGEGRDQERANPTGPLTSVNEPVKVEVQEPVTVIDHKEKSNNGD